MRSIWLRRSPSTPAIERRIFSTSAGSATEGWPLRNGGSGSYSMPSWMVFAASSVASLAARRSAEVDARRHPAARHAVAVEDDAPRGGARADQGKEVHVYAQCVVAS